MKSRSSVLAVGMLLVQPMLAQYQVALPGYKYEFPRDHFNHEAFQTEWWYYTGNLKATGGRRYGFELTFFRQGVDRDSAKNRVWDVQDMYLAHLALSDLDGQHFYHDERLNRAGPGIAGVSESGTAIGKSDGPVRSCTCRHPMSSSS